MLFKLMKHEILASYRKFLPLYLASIGISVLMALSVEIDNVLLMSTSMLFTIGTMMMMVIFTLYTIMMNLGHRVFGKPGYLLFSTPSSTLDILVSKSVVNLMWLGLSGVFSVISVIVFYLIAVGKDIQLIVDNLIAELSLNPEIIFTSSVSLLINGIYTIGFLIFLFTLLNMIYKGEKKIVIGILLYFVLSQVISLIRTSLYRGTQFIPILGGTTGSAVWFNNGLLLLFAAIFYVSSYFIIEKRLELQ
ncbi:MAG: hypothetical protein RBQ91_05040 [Acholeplasma sp.]|nr:hypothetical protein [Acholeplasma sp.]